MACDPDSYDDGRRPTREVKVLDHNSISIFCAANSGAAQRNRLAVDKASFLPSGGPVRSDPALGETGFPPGCALCNDDGWDLCENFSRMQSSIPDTERMPSNFPANPYILAAHRTEHFPPEQVSSSSSSSLSSAALFFLLLSQLCTKKPPHPERES